jgi:hypothetical protein
MFAIMISVYLHITKTINYQEANTWNYFASYLCCHLELRERNSNSSVEVERAHLSIGDGKIGKCVDSAIMVPRLPRTTGTGCPL